MGRIPDHLVRLAVQALENRWVTIGAKPDAKRPGKKKGGTPVELDGDGKITKGPAALTGKRPSELSQSHLFTGQAHKSQRKLFAEPGDPPPPPPIEETPKPVAKQAKEPKAEKKPNMGLLAIVRREGGISSGDYEHADFREFGLLGALKKSGHSLDDMAATLVRQGHITVPAGVSSPGDHLLQLLKKKTKSLLAFDQETYDEDYDDYIRAREEALADGHQERELEEVRGRGEKAGGDQGQDSVLDEIFGWDGSGGAEAGREEPGDLAGDASEPAGGVDTSFDFGPAAAPKVEEKPKAADTTEPEPAPSTPTPPPALDLYGNPEPSKPQPATVPGLFGGEVPAEDKKPEPRETVADQAEKGLDWLDQKQDKKTDGTGEMFGGLFSPGRTSGATEPEAGPVAPPTIEQPKPSSLPDRIQNLKNLLNKTRSSANAKALRTAIARLEREAGGPVAPSAVQASTSKPAHEMTKAEFMQAYMDKANQLSANVKGRKMKDLMSVAGKAIAELGGDHSEQIRKARAAGKPIPQEVLADYPQLKEPHEMSQEEWAANWLKSSPGRAPRDIDMDLVKALRRADVKRAIDAGKEVPASVLNDYPELKAGPAPEQPQQTPTPTPSSGFRMSEKQTAYRDNLVRDAVRRADRMANPNNTPKGAHQAFASMVLALNMPDPKDQKDISTQLDALKAGSPLPYAKANREWAEPILKKMADKFGTNGERFADWVNKQAQGVPTEVKMRGDLMEHLAKRFMSDPATESDRIRAFLREAL